MNKVYAVGCLEIDLSENPKKLFLEQRLWYMCPDFATAEKAILANELDMFENNFNFALIEEISLLGAGEHPYADIPKQWWYGATRKDYEVVLIEPVAAPTCVKNIAYFWVG